MKRQWLLVVCLARTCLGFQPPVVPPLAVRARSHTFLRDTTTTSELPEMEELPSMEPFTHVESPAPAENETMILDDININATIDSDLKMAPPLTFNKFLTMQVCHYIAFTAIMMYSCVHLLCEQWRFVVYSPIAPSLTVILNSLSSIQSGQTSSRND